MTDNTYNPLPISNEIGRDAYHGETKGVYRNYDNEPVLHLTRLLLRLSLLLIAIFTGIVLVIHARPYDDSELRAFLLPEGCDKPCFLGIQPGKTTLEETAAILEKSDWVEIVDRTTYAPNVVTWTWREKKPNFLRSTMGFLTEYEDYISSIYLPTKFQAGEIYFLCGKPTDSGFLPVPDGFRHIVYFGRCELQISSNVNCPIRITHLWREEIDMKLTLPSNKHEAEKYSELNHVFPNYSLQFRGTFPGC